MEATRLARRLRREFEGKKGSDVGGLAILGDLAVDLVVLDCACPDLVQGSGLRLNNV